MEKTQLERFTALVQKVAADVATTDEIQLEDLRAAAEILELSSTTRWGVDDVAALSGATRKVRNLAKSVYEEYMLEEEV